MRSRRSQAEIGLAAAEFERLPGTGHRLDLTFETASRRDGYRGLRVALDMGWALRPVAGIEQLPAFEEEIAAMVDEVVERSSGARRWRPEARCPCCASTTGSGSTRSPWHR